MTKTLLTLALALAGCASEPRTLHLSPELPEHVQSAFFDAAAQWNEAQSQHQLIVSYRPDSHGGFTVNIKDLEGDILGFARGAGTIDIDPGVTEETGWFIAAHELGHHLGKDGHTRGGIMQWQYQPDMRQCIDAEAAALFGGEGTCDK